MVSIGILPEQRSSRIAENSTKPLAPNLPRQIVFKNLHLSSSKFSNQKELQEHLKQLIFNITNNCDRKKLLSDLVDILKQNSRIITPQNLKTIFQIVDQANIKYFANMQDLDFVFQASKDILRSPRFQQDSQENCNCSISLIKSFSAITLGTKLNTSSQSFIQEVTDSLFAYKSSTFSESDFTNLCVCLNKLSDRLEIALPLLNFFTSSISKQGSSTMNNLANNRDFIDKLIELVSRYDVKMPDSLFEIIFVYLENNFDNLDPKLLAKALFHFNSSNNAIINMSEFLLEQVDKEKLQEFNDLDLRMATAALRRTLLRHINEPEILRKYIPQLINFAQEFASRDFSELQHFAALNIYKELGILQHYLPKELSKYISGPFKSLEQATAKQLTLHQHEIHRSEQLVKNTIEEHAKEIFGKHKVQIETNYCDPQTGIECDLLVDIDNGQKKIDLEVDGPSHNGREAIPESLRDQYLSDRQHINVVRIPIDFYEEAKRTGRKLAEIIIARLKPQFDKLLAT